MKTLSPLLPLIPLDDNLCKKLNLLLEDNPGTHLYSGEVLPITTLEIVNWLKPGDVSAKLPEQNDNVPMLAPDDESWSTLDDTALYVLCLWGP